MLIATLLIVVGCNSTYGLRKSTGFPGIETKKAKPPLEYKSEEGVPYVAKLTYGEICVNSKRFAKEYCFPCYPAAQGGCESAMNDLIDKAIVCSASIGPAVPTLPTYQSPPVTYAPAIPQFQPSQPLMPYPNTYPNFSR